MSTDDSYGYNDRRYQRDTGYQPDDSYGGRSSRRTGREPSGPKRASGGAVAAILLLAAILGFGGGAVFANTGGDGGDPSASATDPSDTPTDDETSDDEDSGDDPDDAPSGEGISVTSPQDGGEVASGDSGTIDVQATLDTPEGGVTLSIERSLDGGSTWESFCDACTDETSDGGTYSTNFWSGQSGDNQFRVVGPEGLASNVITVTVGDNDSGDD